MVLSYLMLCSIIKGHIVTLTSKRSLNDTMMFMKFIKSIFITCGQNARMLLNRQLIKMKQ